MSSREKDIEKNDVKCFPTVKEAFKKIKAHHFFSKPKKSKPEFIITFPSDDRINEHSSNAEETKTYTHHTHYHESFNPIFSTTPFRRMRF